MRKYLFLGLIFLTSFCLSDTTTNKLGLTIPTIGSPYWGQKINQDMQIIDASYGTFVGVYPATSTISAPYGVSGTTATFTSSVTASSFYGDGSHLTGIAPGGGGGGSSSLSVNQDGVQVSSPTSQINFKGTNVSVSLGGSTTAQVTISSTSLAFSALTDVNDSGRAINLVPKWNGTQIVWAAYNATYSFSVASFSDSLSSTIEIGNGTWKSIGTITFIATYTNGPATGAYVSKSGWTNLTMIGTGYVGPTSSVEAVSYPSVAGTVVFTLNASKSSETGTLTITHTFVDDRYWGVSTKSSGFVAGDVTGLAGVELSNVIAKTFTVTASAGQYIVYAYPSRLGTATFTVGGFSGGFNSPETVSITNVSGYTENYYVYSSVNSGLGTTTVVVS